MQEFMLNFIEEVAKVTRNKKLRDMPTFSTVINVFKKYD
jgi:hypothetical protein